MDGQTQVTRQLAVRRPALWFVSILLVVVVTSLVGIGIAWNAAANRRIGAERPILQKRTVELRARCVLRPLFFEPEAEGNGWPLLVRAVEGIAAIPPAEFAAFPNLNEDEGAKLNPEEAERLLAKIAPYLEDLKGALRRKWTEPDYVYEDHLNMKSVNLSDVIKVSRVLAGAAKMRQEAGRLEESVDFVILGLGLGDRVATKGHLIHALVSIVVYHIAKDGLLAQYRYDEPSLARLQRAFDLAAATHASVLESMRVEDVYQRHLAFDFATRGSAAISGLGRPDALADSGSVDRIAAQYLEVQDRLIAEVERLAGRPFEESQEGMKVLVQEVVEKSSSKLHLLLLPQVARAFYNEKSLEIEFALIRAAIAAARHREKRGAWPAAWKDLVPDFLPSVPMDPLGSRPLSLVFKDGGLVVYSWGNDGVDDGGTNELDDNHLDMPGVDFVLRMKRYEPEAK